MADNSGNGQAGQGGISDTINKGVEYLQSTVAGFTGGDNSSKGGETSGSDTTQSTTQSTGGKSNIADESVSEFIRDKYKSQPGDWPEQKNE